MPDSLKCIISYICLLLSFLAESQSIFQHWNTGDGLSNNWVSQIIEDEKGYIWAGTQYGLNRFDGYEFSAFHYEPNNPNSFPANWARCITKDTAGTFWVGTYYGGITAFDPVSESMVQYALYNQDSTLETTIYDLICTPDQAIWVGTSTGIFHKPMDSPHFKKVTNQRITDLTSDKKGNIFARSNSAIYQLQPIDYSFHLCVNNTNIRSIYLDLDGDFWAVSYDGLLKMQKGIDGNWEMEYIIKEATSNFNPFYAPPIFLDSQNRLWFGTALGVTIYDKLSGQIERRSQKMLFPEGSNLGHVLSIFEDSHQNIWLGTTEGALLQSMRTKQFEPDAISSTLKSFHNVRELMIIGDEILLANPDGLHQFKFNEPFSDVTQLLAKGIFSILETNTGDVYAGGEKLYAINLSNKEVTLVKDNISQKHLHFDMIWSMVEDWNDKIWITSLKGLYRFDPKNNHFERFNSENTPSLQESPNQALVIDDKGRLWASSLKSGVYLLEKPHELNFGETPQFRQFTYDPKFHNSLSNRLTTYLVSDKAGNIWVSTDAGLNRIDGKDFRIKRYLREDGLVDEKIMALATDEVGNIWGSTVGHGIFRFQIAEEKFTFFGTADGIVSNNLLLSAVHKDKQGQLYFGSDKSIQIIVPEQINQSPRLPCIYLFTKYQTADQAKPIHFQGEKKIVLPHNFQSINIEFSTLNFYQATRTQYEYQLEGVHDTWQSNGNKRQISFTGLAPNHYRLKVRAENPDLQFEQAFIDLTIIVHPPWWRSDLAYFGYIVLMMGLLYGLYQFQVNQQLNKAEARRLQDLDNFKNRFFTNITHELRTPLTVILGLAQQLSKQAKRNIAQKASLIHRNGQDLLDLINQILALAKLEAGHLPLKLEQGDILPFIRYLLESFHSIAAEKNIRLHFLTQLSTLNMDYDREKVKQMIANLLSNAIKNTEEGGDVYVQIEAKEQEAIFSIRDTGKGIEKAHLAHIFDRFYQANEDNMGTGIGLSLTHELIQQLGGQLTVTSKIKEGSTFTFSLPIRTEASPSQSAFIDNEFNIDTSLVTVNNLPLSDHNRNLITENTPIVLIIEDNIDVLNFLVDCLNTDYQVNTANNGAAGIEWALAALPDLIISDVMMPKKDGFEVCETLKNDRRTSHIPIILLTAKVDFASKIAGLQKGADVYLAKPFAEEELRIRVRNLLVNRKKVQTRYQQTEFWTNGLTQEIEEDAFVLEVRNMVMTHLQDAHFGIPQLCRQLGISRTQLHRKLKALTNLSTSHFIRNIRLYEAQKLLKTSQLNISEIAYEVGFSDPAYFSRLFTDLFGIPPSATRK